MPVWQSHEGPRTIFQGTNTSTVGGAIPGDDLRRRRTRRETDNAGAGGGS